MPIGKIIGGVASIGGAILGSKGSKKAANAQVAATEAGIAETRRQYDLTRQDFAPWREAGGQAITAGWDMLQPGYDHTTSPGYQFRFDEGMRAVENSAAARGLLGSGGTLKDLVRFGSGIAADDYNDQFNRNMAVAAGGQQANTATGTFGANAARGIADLYNQQGNARASGYAGQYNAWGNALGSLGDMAMDIWGKK